MITTTTHRIRRMTPALTILICLSATLTSGPVEATPSLVTLQGVLRSASGVPLDGAFDMTFRIYDAPAGGNELWIDVHASPGVTVSGGFFTVDLGSGAVSAGSGAGASSSLQAIFSTQMTLYLEYEVDGEVLAPRRRLTTAPFAFRAGDAESLGGQPATAFAPQAHAHSGSDITTGTVADTRIAATIARDSEIMPIVLSNDGAGSGLDADRLHGIPGSDFALQGHGHPAAPPWRIPYFQRSTFRGPVNASAVWVTLDGFLTRTVADQVAGTLETIVCDDPLCFSETIATLDSSGTVGGSLSIAVPDDGLPIISYHDAVNGDLRVVKCTSVDCTTSSTRAVDSAGTVGEYSSVTIGMDGFPVIAYYDASATVLKFIKCNDTTCSTTDPPVIVDSAPGSGRWVSLSLNAEGRPIMAYQGGGPSVRFAACQDSGCTTPALTRAFFTSPGVAEGVSLTIGEDGLPIIAYSFGTNGLRVTQCANSNCSSVRFHNQPEVAPVLPAGIAMAMGPDGRPIITYQSAAGAMTAMHCSDPACATATKIAIDQPGTGIASAVTIGLDGFPVISYYQPSTGALKLTKCSNPLCVPNWTRR